MADMGELLIEGRTKRLYAGDNDQHAVLYFKDEAIAFQGLKRGRILGKGEVNNAICAHLFTLLSEKGVENHFIKRLDARQSLVKRVEMIPVSIKIRNIIAGSISTRLNLPIGMKLQHKIIEFNLRNGGMDDPLINHTHMLAMGLASQPEIDQMVGMSLKANEIIQAYMQEINVDLIDIRLEFGRLPDGRIIMADEITPDTARFWDSHTMEPLDMDRFRRDMGNAAEGYHELLHRMMGYEE